MSDSRAHMCGAASTAERKQNGAHAVLVGHILPPQLCRGTGELQRLQIEALLTLSSQPSARREDGANVAMLKFQGVVASDGGCAGAPIKRSLEPSRCSAPQMMSMENARPALRNEHTDCATSALTHHDIAHKRSPVQRL